MEIRIAGPPGCRGELLFCVGISIYQSNQHTGMHIRTLYCIWYMHIHPCRILKLFAGNIQYVSPYQLTYIPQTLNCIIIYYMPQALL